MTGASSPGSGLGKRLGNQASILLRFAATVLLTYLGLLAVTFFIGRVIPIDPVLSIVGDRASEELVRQVREELGLNKPLWDQFLIYIQKVLQGDFGTSILTSNPVMQDIRKTFPATIELATLGIVIGAGLGVPLGVWAAVRRGGLVDQVVRVMGLIGYSVPIFWLGLMGLVLFYAKLEDKAPMEAVGSYFDGGVARYVEKVAYYVALPFALLAGMHRRNGIFQSFAGYLNREYIDDMAERGLVRALVEPRGF